MEAEPEQLDAREVKVLADILALVLQDEPGVSSAALETLRRKARQNRMTGGALKNLFQSLAAQAGEARWRQSASDRPEQMSTSVDRLQAANRTLEKALAAANGEAARLQSELDQVQSTLLEAHQFNRGLTERWRSIRRQSGFMAAGLVACILVISALVAEHLIGRSPAPTIDAAPALAAHRPIGQPGTQARPPPAGQPLQSAANRPPPPEPNTPATGPERDPDLERALERLSGGVQQEPAGGEANSPAEPAMSPGMPAPPVPARSGYLSPEVYSGIIMHVRTCWRSYLGRLGDVRFQARLQVVADESGVVREAKLAPEDIARLSEPAYQTFVRAAMRSVLDPGCAQLPIPPAQLGHRIAFDFVFVP